MTWLEVVVVVVGLVGAAVGYVAAAVAMNSAGVRAMCREDW